MIGISERIETDRAKVTHTNSERGPADFGQRIGYIEYSQDVRLIGEHG